MDSYHTTFLGIRELPRDLTSFEFQAFFTFSPAEMGLILARRRPLLKLGLALQIGFLRMTGRSLNAFRVVPISLWRHLSAALGVRSPEIASLRALYQREQTLFDHQQLAGQALKFSWIKDGQRRNLIGALRDEVTRTVDRGRLMVYARRWLYDHQLLVLHDRALRQLIVAAVAQFEAALAKSIRQSVPPSAWARWEQTIMTTHASGGSTQNWLWAAPAKHSTRQIAEMFERVEFLRALGVDQHLIAIPDGTLRRYARRMASRAPSAGVRIKEPVRTIEVSCFLRYCLLAATDQLILMVRRRVADLWRQAAEEITDTSDWAQLYQELLNKLIELTDAGLVPDAELRNRLEGLLAASRARRPLPRAQRIRDRLIDAVRPIHGLLVGLTTLPWQATGEQPVIEAITCLRERYAGNLRVLPDGQLSTLGSGWSAAITGLDRGRAFRALETATLFALRRAVRSGSVWVAHSFSFRSRDQLFLPAPEWAADSPRHYARLALPTTADAFLQPLLGRVETSLQAVAAATRTGQLRVDGDLHLRALPADEESPEVVKLRAALDRRMGEIQLPELILTIDAQVHFSWIMLGREPRSHAELLTVYAGILAHGTALSAADTARMIPQLSARAVRQAMHWANDEHRLAEASAAVLAFMHQHPVAATWGRADLASSDMMSLETSQRVWRSRVDPRRQTASIGIYSHVRDRWGIFYAQPIVLNERQAGAAIEGVVRQERVETAQLAVDTHGYTDFAMALARLLGFDLCPRLKELKQRQLYVPRGSAIPEEIRSITLANGDLDLIKENWDSLVHLAASVSTGHCSAVAASARFGSAARGDPIYEAGKQLGRLLRTVFLADYWVNDAFRRELLRVLNRGEAVNALKRAIYAGRVANYQAKRDDEMQAVADALGLLANIVMAWNTAQMQAVLDGWAKRRQIIPADLIGRIAPTRTEGINLRGIFRFPIERFEGQILPSLSNSKIAAHA